MRKKTTISISIILVCLVIIRLLYSPNFLFIPDNSIDRYKWLYQSSLLDKVKCVYTFRNFKNEETYHDIDDKIRCRIWKFNEYSMIPSLDTINNCDTIVCSNCLNNSYGVNPGLSVYNKQLVFLKGQKSLRITKSFNMIEFESNKNYMALDAELTAFGIFNSNNICEIKYQFDKLTRIKLIFYKGIKDYYIILYYGINGYKIDNKTEVFISINDWNK